MLQAITLFLQARITHISVFVVLASSLFGAFPAYSQGGYISQAVLKEMLDYRIENVDELPEVYYNYFKLYNRRNNNVMARNTLFKVLGDGDLMLGKKRSKLVELLNRKLVPNSSIGDTLIVPSEFETDFRAYSPFPLYYPGGASFDKLFIIEKSLQAFAAYQNGNLVRWGIVNTGSEESKTPNGRYNFNWKTEYRVSSLSPPGEPWEMYWVFNFHLARGIHTHQYAMPTGGPTSHGCVRLIDADAEWVYNWADTWRTTSASKGFPTSYGRIVEPGTVVLVIGEDPPAGATPQPFIYESRYPVLKRIMLPAHPHDIPPGTPQQEYFDKLRLSSID